MSNYYIRLTGFARVHIYISGQLVRELGLDQLLERELGLLVVSPGHSRPLGVDGDRRGPQGHQPQRTPHNLAHTIHTGFVTTNDIARERNTSATGSDGGSADTDSWLRREALAALSLVQPTMMLSPPTRLVDCCSPPACDLSATTMRVDCVFSLLSIYDDSTLHFSLYLNVWKILKAMLAYLL